MENVIFDLCKIPLRAQTMQRPPLFANLYSRKKGLYTASEVVFTYDDVNLVLESRQFDISDELLPYSDLATDDPDFGMGWNVRLRNEIATTKTAGTIQGRFGQCALDAIPEVKEFSNILINIGMSQNELNMIPAFCLKFDHEGGGVTISMIEHGIFAINV